MMSKPPCDPLLITKRPGPNGENSHRRISIPVEFHPGSSARVPRLPKMLRVAFNAASLRGGTPKPPAVNTRFGYYCYGEGGCQQGKSLGSSFARKRNKRKLFAKKSLKISQSPAGSCAHEFFTATEDKASLHSHSQRQNNVNKELDGRISACKRDNVFEKSEHLEALKFLLSSPQCYTPDDSWNLYTSGSTSSSCGSGSTISSCPLETAGNTSANTKLNSLDFQRLNTVLPDESSWKFLSKKKFGVTEREISRRCFLNGLNLVEPRKIDEKPMMSIFELELESNSGGEGVKSCLNRRSESGYLRKREPKSVRFLIDEEVNKNNSKNEDIENSCSKNVLEVDGSLNENISNKVEHENFKLFTPASITVGPFKRLSRAFISTSASGFGDGNGDDVDVETKANISDLRIINPTLELEMTSSRETEETKMRNLKVDINGVTSFHSRISREADNDGDLTSMPRDNTLGQSLNSNLNRIPSADRDKCEYNRTRVFADGINPTDRLTTAATASGEWERSSGASGVRSPNGMSKYILFTMN